MKKLYLAEMISDIAEMISDIIMLGKLNKII